MTTIALAGRRIDPEGPHTPRFPLTNVELVRKRLVALFAELTPDRLVCSAACGADLLALEAAKSLGIRRRTIVLPFAPERFLETSVLDRPGDWGPAYRRLVAEARDANELIVLSGEDGDTGYAAANARIIEEAAAGPEPVECCVVYDGESRGPRDLTVAIQAEATRRGWPVFHVMTL